MTKTYIAGVFALSVAAGLLGGVTQANAQQLCQPTEVVTSTLTENYGEHEIFGGLDAQERLVQMYLNPETGTWTAVMSTPNGISCVVAAGEYGSLNDYTYPEGEEM